MPTHREVIERLTAQNENLRRALCVIGAHFRGEPGYTRVRAEVAAGDALEGSPVEPDNHDLDPSPLAEAFARNRVELAAMTPRERAMAAMPGGAREREGAGQ